MAKSYRSAPNLSIDQKKHYTATIHTEKGDIEVDLYSQSAPTTVNNFVFLAREGFYDGVTFHRVIPGFMAQTGDPTGTGSGGPGYQFSDEPGALRLHHDGPGVVSMANAGPNTNGSQFFITHVATPHLDGRHAVFGLVTKGLDVVMRIRPRDPMRASQPGDTITSIDIAEEDQAV
ncbi:MAG: peptidylprolyl isomerase [Chloroflexi bacterium]|nr:peptidylprolyl isomerase [Chloroflexota bacterium]